MFSSNLGTNDLTMFTYNHTYTQLKPREDITLKDTEKVLSTAAYNEMGK